MNLKGRGLSEIGRGGGTPPIKQLELKPKYFDDVLDTRGMDSAKGMNFCSEMATVQVQIDEPSEPNQA